MISPVTRRLEEPYSDFNPEYYKGFLLERSFRIRTLAGFKVEYELRLIVSRVNDEEFKKAQMLGKPRQAAFVSDYNEALFLPFLDERSCFFRIEWTTPVEAGKIYQIFRGELYQVIEDDDGFVVKGFLDTRVRGELMKIPFAQNGCKAMIGYFDRNDFSEELIKENYAMLTEEQKATILADERFGAYEELLAVGALRRQLDFFGTAMQKHEAEMFTIETERAGRALKIKWRFKESASSGYYLWGFKDQGGFFKDAWDEANNGPRVIDSYRDGETTELLDEGDAYFYTFFLQPFQESERSKRCSSLRFQITVETNKEREAIEATLRRLGQRKPPVDPGRENMSQALKELGLVMEFDEAIDEMEKSLIERIKKKNLPKEEEEEKIEFVRDAARLQRDKYQP
jgi:hypothetical protein